MPVVQLPFLVFTASMEAMLLSSSRVLLPNTPAPTDEVTEERAVVAPPAEAFGVGVVVEVADVADSSSSSSISGNRGIGGR